MERLWNVTIERPDDGMAQAYASIVLREWCESAQIACIRVKAHMLPRGWRIVSCEPMAETA